MTRTPIHTSYPPLQPRAVRALACGRARAVFIVTVAALFCVLSVPASAQLTPAGSDNGDGYFPAPSGTPAGKPDGYLPDNPSTQPAFNPMVAPRSPIQGGLALGIAVQVPTGGDLRLPGEPREMRPSVNLAFSGMVRFGEYFDLEAGIVGGVGGLNSQLYEDVFGLNNMNSVHLWMGFRARAYLLDRGPVRPFVSGQFGGDRLAAIYSEGTGVLECEEGFGGRFSCTEITEREFAVGYWGMSAGFGAGVRIPNLSKVMGLIIEGYGVRNRYGRATNSQVGTTRLREDSPVVWSGGGMIVLHVGAQ